MFKTLLISYAFFAIMLTTSCHHSEQTASLITTNDITLSAKKRENANIGNMFCRYARGTLNVMIKECPNKINDTNDRCTTLQQEFDNHLAKAEHYYTLAGKKDAHKLCKNKIHNNPSPYHRKPVK